MRHTCEVVYYLDKTEEYVYMVCVDCHRTDKFMKAKSLMLRALL